MLNYNKDFENYGEAGEKIYEEHQSELELDNINLLYVTLTRPIEQLYIISSKDISSKGVVNQKRYSGLFIIFGTYVARVNLLKNTILKLLLILDIYGVQIKKKQ